MEKLLEDINANHICSRHNDCVPVSSDELGNISVPTTGQVDETSTVPLRRPKRIRRPPYHFET